MKLEDLYKKLRENDEIGKCCLAAIIENQCKRMEREELEGKGKTVCYIRGCLEALCAIGEITEDEECMIWKEIMLRAYGGDDTMKIIQGAAFMALLIGAGGIMDPAGKIQPAAVALVGIALVVLLAAGRKTWMEDLSRAWEQAWSLENIESHEEAGENLEYIGSREKGNRIYDFFEDDRGHYWYRARIRLSDGQAVSEEEGVFGHRIRHQGKRRKNVP